MRILVVEDEKELLALIVRALTRAGHEVSQASDGSVALEEAKIHRFDLLVLDVNLPGCDGFEVLRGLREFSVPSRVMMLTARSEVADRIEGLKAGADDYLTKPFSMDELLARVDALGRRGGEMVEQDVVELRDIVMDLRRRQVTRGGEVVELSPREFEVLTIFIKEPGRTFSRDEICHRIWEREHEYDTRTVEIFIMRLRKKLGADGSTIIKTVRGVGYVMEDLA